MDGLSDVSWRQLTIVSPPTVAASASSLCYMSLREAEFPDHE